MLRTRELAPRKVPMFPVMARLLGEGTAGAGSNRTLPIEVGNLIDESMPISTTVGQTFLLMSALGGKRTLLDARNRFPDKPHRGLRR